jgi:hypothetical protein
MSLALPRLLQLASPALPVGAYTYSQGLEWAVEAGVVRDREDCRALDRRPARARHRPFRGAAHRLPAARLGGG